MPWHSAFGVEVPDDDADQWNTLLQRAQEFRAGGIMAPVTTDEPTTGQIEPPFTVTGNIQYDSFTSVSNAKLEEMTKEAAASLSFYFNNATSDEDIPFAVRQANWHNAEAAWAALAMVLQIRGILTERYI